MIHNVHAWRGGACWKHCGAKVTFQAWSLNCPIEASSTESMVASFKKFPHQRRRLHAETGGCSSCMLTSCELLLGSLCRLHPHRAHIHVVLSRKIPLQQQFTVSSYLSVTLGFYEALLGLLNPVDKFTISLASIWIYDDSLFFVNNTVPCFHTLEIMHLPLAFLTHVFSLTI